MIGCGLPGFDESCGWNRVAIAASYILVINTATNQVVANLDPLYNTRKMLEIDFQNNSVVFAPINRTSVGY